MQGYRDGYLPRDINMHARNLAYHCRREAGLRTCSENLERFQFRVLYFKAQEIGTIRYVQSYINENGSVKSVHIWTS